MIYKDQGDNACKEKEFSKAVDLYTRALKMNCEDDELNAHVYYKRTKAHLYMGMLLGSVHKNLLGGGGGEGWGTDEKLSTI